MITVPASLKNEIKKLRGRRLRGRVRIDYSDVNIDNTIVGFSNGSASGTYEDQVFNGREDMSAKFVSLDGVWVLDGSYQLGPVTEAEKARLEIGWWSRSQSVADGKFVDNDDLLSGEQLYGEQVYTEGLKKPELSLVFTPRTFSDFRVSFDNQREEWATDFDIVLYDNDGVELFRQVVTDNSGFRYIASIAPQNLVARLVLEVKGWSLPNSQAKVAEFVTSVSDLYEGDDIFSMQIIENRSIEREGNPIGSVASGQCVIRLFNRFRQFDYDNTTSKLFNLVRENVRIRPEIGDGVNWIPMGVFFAKAWDIPKNDIVVTVTGLDRMALLQESVYDKSQVIQSPPDESFDVDSTGDWAGGILVGAIAENGEIRMDF
jgi:hypothetical protein